MRARMGRLLRRWADRIDPDNAMRKSGYSYTVERGMKTKYPNGIAIHVDGTGTSFWTSAEDRDRRYTDAVTDWRSPNEKLADMLNAFGEPREDT